jgi:hypothetical protein
LLLSLFLAAGAAAWEHNQASGSTPLSTHDIVLDAHSWTSFCIVGASGDILSGEFKLLNEGELFPGDQTEYDNWLLGGIDFLVMDEANFSLWKDELTATPILERHTLVELSWSIVIPYSGMWHIIYINDSIFMKELEGSINHVSQSGLILIFALGGVASCVSFLSFAAIYRKKKGVRRGN